MKKTDDFWEEGIHWIPEIDAGLMVCPFLPDSSCAGPSCIAWKPSRQYEHVGRCYRLNPTDWEGYEP